jgi:hypothetical protein
MPIPEYENIAKWLAFFRRLPVWLKTLAIATVVITGGIILYDRFGPIRELRKENQNLMNDLSQAQTEIGTLRDKKNELYLENLHLKELIDPIQKRAELLYPELESAAAIAKLTDDLQNVRSLATQDVYKPLAEDHKDKMIAALRVLHARYSTQTPSVTIVVQQGSSARSKVANDLNQYLREAGWKSEVKSAMLFYKGMPPDISIELHPEDISLVDQLSSIIGTFFINKRFTGIKKHDFSRGHVEITINGDPLFTESGIVTFR